MACLLLVIGMAGCGSSGAGSGSQTVSPAACNVSVNTGTTYQTLEGFGAAIAWYGNLLTGNSNKAEIYDLLFKDSGLDILRLRNTYGDRNGASFCPNHEDEIVREAKARNPALKVLICSWSPPTDLKMNGVLNGGTLAKVNGGFNYSGFADYWYNSLVNYAGKGIVPDYISIQNEPDYQNTGWETCLLDPVEGTNAGYGKALDAVFNRIQALPNKPKLIGPETSGIAGKVQTYYANLNGSELDGVAHHLYNGGTGNQANIVPDSFIANMQGLANSYYPNKPLFQTEYDYGTPLQTGQLIINALVNENVNAYFYWDLIWDSSQRPLVVFPKSGSGYTVSDWYYVFKQFAKFTDAGYTRVAAAADSNAIKTVAFVSPGQNQRQLSVILINPGNSTTTATLNLNGFPMSGSAIYRTVSGTADKCSDVGSLGSGNAVALPAQSITTVVIQ